MKEFTYQIAKKEITFDGFDDYIDLWLFGDIHRDASSCDVDRWKWFLKKAREGDPDKTWYLGMGDYHDFASTSEQRKIKNSALHETTMETIEDMVHKRNRALSIEMGQMRGKLLGLVEGNHTWVFDDGTTSTEDLADRMETQYLGWLCHYTINFKFGNKRTQSVNIVACHGKAGGKTMGITINQVDDLTRIFPVADIYCMGHDHQRGAWPKNILVPISQSGDIKQKRQFLCRSGSFKIGYEKGKGGYEIRSLYRPSDLGALKLRISFHRDRSEGIDRIITDMEAKI